VQRCRVRHRTSLQERLHNGSARRDEGAPVDRSAATVGRALLYILDALVDIKSSIAELSHYRSLISRPRSDSSDATC
jgi:hypothetical protein